MLIGSLVGTILKALLITAGLWIICIIVVKKICPASSLNIKYHLFSFVIAVITFALCISFSVTSKTLSFVNSSVETVKTTFLQNSNLQKRISDEMVKAGMDAGKINNETFKVIIEEYISAPLKKYPFFTKYAGNIDTDNLLSLIFEQDISINTSSLAQTEVLSASIIDFYADQLTKPVKRAKWGVFIAIVLVQLAYFGLMLYFADKAPRRKAPSTSRRKVYPKRYNY